MPGLVVSLAEQRLKKYVISLLVHQVNARKREERLK